MTDLTTKDKVLGVGGWMALAEILGKLFLWGIELWGEPTEEVKRKLLANLTLPTPGEADAAITEIEAHLPPQ